MTSVDRIHPALLENRALDTALVIDVLRATSTAIVLLARGAGPIRIVERPEHLHRLREDEPRSEFLVFSELDAARDYGLECVDNSPVLAQKLSLDERQAVLVTTNGTRALAAAVARANAVLLAGFVNLSSTARWLSTSAQRVTLLPAGDFEGNEPRTEDERCADAFEELLRGKAPDLERLIAACWADARVKRRLALHPELSRDFELALTADRYDVVAVATPAASGIGFDASVV